MLFPFDRKITQNTRKIISIHIFTSNHFQTLFQTHKERERERDRFTRSTDESHPAPVRSHPLSPLEVHQHRHLDRHHPRPIHPKLISSSTHPRPSSFTKQCLKHWQVVPSNFVVPSIPETQKPGKPIPQSHSDEPIRQTHHSDEPIPQTHFSNPHWPPPISLSLSLSHLSPSLTLRCCSDFFVLIFVSLIVYIF